MKIPIYEDIMKTTLRKGLHRLLPLTLCLFLAHLAAAQAPSAAGGSAATSALPRLVRFGGAVKDLNGSPLTGVVGITFALNSEQTL